MKNRLHIRYLLFFFTFSIFVSCKKDDKASPTPTPTTALYNTVLGKWTVIRPSGRIQHNIASKIQSPVELTSIEFLNDSTYVVITGENDVTTGTFTVTDSTSITLTGFGSLSEIKVADGKMDFKLFYNGSSLVLSANKAAEITLTSDTKLLCRTWYLTKEEYGDSVYSDTEDGADKITVLFSSAGTYLVQFFKQNTLLSAQAQNWKWHASKPMTIQYWHDDEQPDEDSYLSVTDLNSSSLKITETMVDGNQTHTYKYVFTPYSHSGRIAQASMKNSVSSRNSRTHGMFSIGK